MSESSCQTRSCFHAAAGELNPTLAGLTCAARGAVNARGCVRWSKHVALPSFVRRFPVTVISLMSSATEDFFNFIQSKRIFSYICDNEFAAQSTKMRHCYERRASKSLSNYFELLVTFAFLSCWAITNMAVILLSVWRS